MTEMKFTIVDHNTKETQTLPISEIIENINRDRSDEWIDYGLGDWIEGLCNFTEFNLVLEKGTRMFWSDPDNGICSGKVTVSRDVMVVDGDSVVPTDKGDIPLHELNKNPVG